MTLAQIAAGTANVSIQDFGGSKPLAKEIQSRLITLGCLDPPADGSFGPVSRFVVPTFAKTLGLPSPQAITPAIAKALLQQTPQTYLPWTLGTDLASRLVKFMLANRLFVARLPGFLTIVYIEGANADGKPNPDKPNEFNDRRIVLRREANGKPVILHNVLSTTEPGKHFTVTPMNDNGAARIAFGQYKAWRVGFHRADQSPPRKHEALVQVESVTVHRDKNKDGKRTGDRTFTGVFGINQHHAHDAPASNIGTHGAGCLVGRSKAEHQAFMALVKKDPRFASASKGYVFMTTVINGDTFGAFA